MSSFFTLPSSQKKRKRTEASGNTGNAPKLRVTRDESISGSDDSEDEGRARNRTLEDEVSDEDDEEIEGEDPAAKRVRLAEQYLANTRKEVLDDEGFDAADVDQDNLRHRMGERLKEDTAESKGKLYRWIGESLDWAGAKSRVIRCQGIQKSVTGVALSGRYVYAASKDLHLAKWELPRPAGAVKGKRVAKKPKLVAHTRGNRKTKTAQHHHAPILCIAASQDGKFVATGGADKKLIVWDAASLQPLTVFPQHRDAVTSLTFRGGTNQLFSASKDRTVKIWSLDELAYVETLFGHQDEVVDVSALAQEKCVTVGARDRTARLWKVVEESQLVFRGGGAPGTFKALEKLKKAYEDDSGVEMPDDIAYHEGSMDRVAMIEDDTFLTASDNGSLSLWNVNKKKAVFTLPLAHGLDPALPIEQASAEQEPDQTLSERSRGGKQPRWITALKAIPFSDIVITGSWDGYIRAWKISQDKRRIEPLGALGAVSESVDDLLEKEGLSSSSLTNGALEAMKDGAAGHRRIDGIVNDLAIIDRGDRGKEGVLVAAAVGKEHRFGRWKEVPGGKNYVVLFEVPKKALDSSLSDDGTNESQSVVAKDDGEFAGFD